MEKDVEVMKFDHIHIKCHDVESTERFYKQMFNARTIEKYLTRNTPTIMMELGGTFIVLVNAEKDEVLECPKPRRKPMTQSMIRYGLGHFGVRVKNLDEAAQVLRERGAEFLVDPREGSRGGRSRFAFIRGPEEDAIEIVERGN